MVLAFHFGRRLFLAGLHRFSIPDLERSLEVKNEISNEKSESKYYFPKPLYYPSARLKARYNRQLGFKLSRPYFLKHFLVWRIQFCNNTCFYVLATLHQAVLIPIMSLFQPYFSYCECSIISTRVYHLSFSCTGKTFGCNQILQLANENHRQNNAGFCLNCEKSSHTYLWTLE